MEEKVEYEQFYLYEAGGKSWVQSYDQVGVDG